MPVSESKAKIASNFNRLLDSYERAIFIKLDNVTSQQMHSVRRDVLGWAEIVCGKKTTQKKVIAIRAEKKEASATDKKMAALLVEENKLSGHIALAFTNKSVADLIAIFDKYRVQAPARVGAISPVEVIIPAGNTGMEPTQTSFFQALNISTKINKGTVEIVSDKKVLSPGDKVDTSTAALLQKLKISPFWYKPEIEAVWEKGVLFTMEDLKVTDELIEEALVGGIANLTGLSLGSGVVTELSLPYAIADSFKNLLAASVASDYEFSEYDGKKLRADIKSGKAQAAAAAAPSAKAAPEEKKKEAEKPAPKKEEKKPDPPEDDDFIGGLF